MNKRVWLYLGCCLFYYAGMLTLVFGGFIFESAYERVVRFPLIGIVYAVLIEMGILRRYIRATYPEEWQTYAAGNGDPSRRFSVIFLNEAETDPVLLAHKRSVRITFLIACAVFIISFFSSGWVHMILEAIKN